jgi:hypothetical protein
MKINITLEVKTSTILQLVKDLNLEVVDHDFGYFRTEHHNRPVWHEDIQKAVKVDNSFLKLDEYIAYYHKDELLNRCI